MLFCPKCGMILREFVKEGKKNFGICIKGHKIPLNDAEMMTHCKIETKRKDSHKKNTEIPIIDEEEELKGRTFTSIPCPHCDAAKSQLLYSFNPWGDEESVHILRCLGCGKNFRIGYGA